MPGKKLIVKPISNEISFSRSFKVGVDFYELDKMSKPEFWPHGEDLCFFEQQKKIMKNSFNILNLNVRPIKEKIDHVQQFLDEEEINIGMLIEQWMPDINPTQLQWKIFK